MKKIDAMGKVCPIPVIETKKVLKSEEGKDGVIVLVDNEISTQNLSKMADQLGLSHEVKKISPQEFEVTIGGKGETISSEKLSTSIDTSDYVVAIGANKMGDGADELSQKLIGSFIYSLTEQDEIPKYMVFYNSGVELTCQDSKAIQDLEALKAAGVEILSCGLCLNYYGLTEKLAVGEVTNMYRITEILRSHHVVRP